MKSATYWPTDATKQQFAIAQAQIAVDAAASWWEETTGWAPFLSDGTVSTRPYAVSRRAFNGVLKLNAGLLSLQGVAVGGYSINTGSVVAQPCDGPSRGKPYSWLELPRYGGGIGALGSGAYGLGPLRLSVTGVWGRCAALPAEVYDTVLEVAARSVLTVIENLQSIGSLSQEGFSKSFDIVGILTAKDVTALWGKEAVATAEKYKRRV